MSGRLPVSTDVQGDGPTGSAASAHPGTFSLRAIRQTMLSRDEARSLTDEVRGDAERLWRKLVELYEGGAHLALGYSSWEGYFKAEFGGSRSHAHRLLDAGRVARALDSPPGGAPLPSEKHARALVPLKNDPETLREAWAEVNKRTDQPTAADVREVVADLAPVMSRKAEMNANASKRKLYDVLSSVGGYCGALADFNLERAVAAADKDDIAAWERIASDSVRALNNLKKSLKEASQ